MKKDGFTAVARFGSELEAELVGHALDACGIPFFVKSEDTLFGQGSASAATKGAALWVPAQRVEEVEQLLSGLMKPPPDDVEGTVDGP